MMTALKIPAGRETGETSRARRRNRIRVIALAFAAIALAAEGAFAACGLSFCPRPDQPGVKSLELGFMARQTAFDIQGTAGGFTELVASAQYTVFGRLALGLHAPLILLEAEGTETGLGNFSAYAELRARPAWLSAFGAGVQLEIPMGGRDHGLGDDHWMAVPYASLARRAGPLMLGAALGASFTVPGANEGAQHHAGHEPVPVYVHPHGHFEFLYRLSAGMSLLRGTLLPEGFLDGQRVLGDPGTEGADRHFLAAGVSLPWQRGPVTVAPNASFPLLADSRSLWSAGITLGWKLGFGGARSGTPGEI